MWTRARRGISTTKSLIYTLGRAAIERPRSAMVFSHAPAALLVAVAIAVYVLAASPAAAQRCPDGTYWRSGRCRADEQYPYNRSEVYRAQRCLGPFNYCAAVCRQDVYNSGRSALRRCLDRCEREYEACEARPFTMDAQ